MDRLLSKATIESKLLKVISILVTELNQGRSTRIKVKLNSSLDTDLRFDSLTKVELISRVEHEFNIRLPDSTLNTILTPMDLVSAILNSEDSISLNPFDSHLQSIESSIYQPESNSTETGIEIGDETVPNSANTLIEVLQWHNQHHPNKVHIYLYGESNNPIEVTYRDLLANAQKIAIGLKSKDIGPQDSVAIMLPTSKEYLFSFMGILLCGAIPVPIYPPSNLFQLEDHITRHVGILDNSESKLLITIPEANKIAHLIKAQVDSIESIASPSGLMASGGLPPQHNGHKNEIAFLQYTSGSTGQPKGVMLTHDNLLANIRAMGAAAKVNSNDVFVSWLPLYHDMGLIGAWFTSLYFGMTLALMSPTTFLLRPAQWLRAISNHKGTISGGPNFAFEFCTKKIKDSEIEGVDLSSLRFLFNGAEAVSAHTIQLFIDRFKSYKLNPNAFAPVYGLAEAAVGLAFPPPDRGLHIDTIQKEKLTMEAVAVKADKNLRNHATAQIVACGRPLPGYEIRIVDEINRELPDRHQGRLQFIGPSATNGYFKNQQATQKLYQNGWLDTGDLAYIANGDVYLTGRVKDVIIRGGRNIYPHQLEEAIGKLNGIRKGCIAVVGVTEPKTKTEKLIVVAETRLTDKSEHAKLEQEIASLCSEILATPADDIIIAPPHTVLKTSSGKIRRAAIGDLYQQGKLLRGPRKPWLQIASVAITSFNSSLKHLLLTTKKKLYAIYTLFLFWTLSPIFWVLVLVSPSPKIGRTIMRIGASLLIKLSGIPLNVKGIKNLPKNSPVVITANHASYIDGIIMAAVLPIKYSFIAKGELKQNLLANQFLKKIQAALVERSGKQQAANDAEKVTNLIKSGMSLMFFPEGTFTRRPGLLPFQIGAFEAASEANTPIIPVTINGTRSILREDDKFPFWGRIDITIGEEIKPNGNNWKDKIELRDKVRNAILKNLEEPDLLEQ